MNVKIQKYCLQSENSSPTYKNSSLNVFIVMEPVPKLSTNCPANFSHSINQKNSATIRLFRSRHQSLSTATDKERTMLNIDISEIIVSLPPIQCSSKFNTAMPNGLCASIIPVSIKTLQEQHGEGPNKFLNDVSELIQVRCILFSQKFVKNVSQQQQYV